MQKLLLILFSVLVLFSCKKESDDSQEKIFYVASVKGTSTNWNGQSVPSLLVKENPGDAYWPLAQDIEGFTYEEGFEYKIEVQEVTLKNPPADASDKRYILKRIISKQ